MDDLFSEFIEYGAAHYQEFYEAERLRLFEDERKCVVEIISNLKPETAFHSEADKSLLQKPYERLALDIYMCAIPTDKEQQQAAVNALHDVKLKLKTVDDCLTLLQREKFNIAGNLAVKGSYEGNVDAAIFAHNDAINYLNKAKAQYVRGRDRLAGDIAGFKGVQAVVKGEKFIYELMRCLDGKVCKWPKHDVFVGVASAALKTTVDVQASKDAKRKLKKVGFFR